MTQKLANSAIKCCDCYCLIPSDSVYCPHCGKYMKPNPQMQNMLNLGLLYCICNDEAKKIVRKIVLEGVKDDPKNR